MQTELSEKRYLLFQAIALGVLGCILLTPAYHFSLWLRDFSNDSEEILLWSALLGLIIRFIPYALIAMAVWRFVQSSQGQPRSISGEPFQSNNGSKSAQPAVEESTSLPQPNVAPLPPPPRPTRHNILLIASKAKRWIGGLTLVALGLPMLISVFWIDFYFSSVGIFMGVLSLLELGLQIFYLIHLMQNPLLSQTHQVVLGLGIFFLPIIIMPVYFYRYIWGDRFS